MNDKITIRETWTQLGYKKEIQAEDKWVELESGQWKDLYWHGQPPFVILNLSDFSSLSEQHE